MKTKDFDFDLPPELIAQRPASPRQNAKLLDARAQLVDRVVDNISDLLLPSDLIVFNNTRVIAALLYGIRYRFISEKNNINERKISITLHKQVNPGKWLAYAKPAKQLKIGDTVEYSEDFRSKVLEKREMGEVLLEFNLKGSDFYSALKRYGNPPLPPYIKRSSVPDSSDLEDYQTIFAKQDGAVAAPTAGLHFTSEIMAKLAKKGIAAAPLTLHVGAGTYLPVKVENILDHKMHEEYGELSAETAEAVNKTHKKGGRVLAVGTTSLRLLESAVNNKGLVKPFIGNTDIFITPGYRFNAVDLLLTNFHLPRSTLYMLVCAFAGENFIRSAYNHAIKNRYRFYSYGDAMLLKKTEKNYE
ncbi:MAG: tRNA preQ1(34) S-adenosylmethionine ribosyltransferase-isomerase QueA [Rhodospirillales bacterium]|nr:tRNA preQ1(34) S-adenosylmethionine ribosyltransferase-isomerase QueA [Rhodospirillales bacterium]|tara:strand:- start:16069 stop:17142 length:1074 start_codon:yes stop_codon:yes gene_type:complete